MKSCFIWLVLSAFLIVQTACEKDDPVIPNEEELITTILFNLTPTGGGDPVQFTFTDLDGDGGNPPLVTEEPLAANTTYAGSLLLLDETQTPAEDITLEIVDEAEEHQFFFEITGDVNLTIAYDDNDANNNPVGVITTVTTGEASEGEVTITLRHEPDKSAPGVADGDITMAGGETDIAVVFAVQIQ